MYAGAVYYTQVDLIKYQRFKANPLRNRRGWSERTCAKIKSRDFFFLNVYYRLISDPMVDAIL